MKNTQKKMLFFSVLIIVLAVVGILVIYNVMMRNYIEKEAQAGIRKEIQWYKLYSTKELENDDDSRSSPIAVDSIFLNAAGNYENHISEREKSIITYMRDHPLAQEEIRSVSIKNEDYYLSQIRLNLEYAAEAPSNEEPAGRFVKEDTTIVLYVSVMPLKLFSNTVNAVFISVMLLMALLSGYAGIRFGKQIENSQDRMNEFFQNVSHELKTPIMSIQGYAEGLQKGVIKESEKATQIIMDESRKMAELIEELLCISKIDSGVVTVRKEPIEISELLYDCLRSVEMIAHAGNIELNVAIEDEMSIFYGDEKQLATAFSNVLTNAIKYAKQSVQVQCMVETRQLQISIGDDGAGISKEDLPHVFERFYSGKNGNTGIGLALAKKIIEIHEGTIGVTSDDAGAKFVIRLPLA